MWRWYLIVILCSVLICLGEAPETATRPAGPQVELDSVRVGYRSRPEGEAYPKEIVVGLRVRNLGGDLLESRVPLLVLSCTDNVGTKLAPPVESMLGPWSGAPDDRQSGLCTASFRIAPAANATKLLLRADLSATIGRERREHVVKNVPLRFGEEITTEPAVFKIVALERLDHPVGDVPFDTVIELQTDSTESFGQIHLLNAEGKEIGSGRGGPSMMVFQKGKQQIFRCTALGPGRAVTFSIEHYGNVETVEVPVKIEAPLEGAKTIDEVTESERAGRSRRPASATAPAATMKGTP